MILILGGGGFVGSAFVRYCEREGLEFAAIGRENYAQFVGTECDLLINANGNSRKPLSVKEPLTDFQMSVESVVRSTLDFKARKYVFLSSCDVYHYTETPIGNEETTPIDLDKVSRYGFHKHLAEQYVQFACDSWLVLRLAGMVGPGLKKNAIYDILNGGPLWLDPESELQFMHTDEVARHAFSLANTLDRDVVNLCGSRVVSLKDAMTWHGTEVSVTPNSPKVRYEVNNAKLRGLVQVTDSAQTVKDFIQGVSAR